MTGAPEKYFGNGGIGVPCSQFAHSRCPARTYKASVWDAVSAFSSRSDNPACTASTTSSGHRLRRRDLRALARGRASGRALANSSVRAVVSPVRLLREDESGRQGPDRAEGVLVPGDVSRVIAGLPPARYALMRPV